MMKNRGRSPSATATHGRLEANLSSRGGHSPHSSEAGDLPHSPREGLSVRDSHTPRESHTSRDSHTPRESHTHSREPSSVNSSLAVDEGGIQYSPSHSGTLGDTSGLGSNTIWYDELDTSGVGLDPERKQKSLGQIQSKLSKTREQIKEEQVAKELNVDEYLRLSSSADKQQLARIKQVFEKKNQKSAQNIAQLQKKLENYQRKARDIEQYGSVSGKQPILKVVGLGIKTVGGGVVGTLSKPKEFAHLIRNKFGSVDNIPSHIPKERDDDERRSHHGSASLPREGSTRGSVLSDKIRLTSLEDPVHLGSDDARSVPRTSSSITSSERGGEELPGQDAELSPRNSGTRNLGLNALMSEISSLREETERLREELEEQRQQFKQELDYVTSQLREDRFRTDRLEEQINDLTELHQNEMENIRSGVTDMEEKVQYQSEERLRDIQDQLSGLETKISRMEHQAAQHQQYVTFEGLENSNARALVVKAINILLTLLQVVLLLLETGAQILKPFLKTPTRMVTTLLLVTVIILAIRQWTELSTLAVGRPKDLKKQDL